MRTHHPCTLVLAVLVGAGCGTPRRGLENRNLAIVLRYFDEWANQGNTATADALIAPDLVLVNPPSTTRSLAEYKAGMAGFHAAFPDLRFDVEDRVAAGDRVVIRWRLTGTQAGDFQGRPASGKAIAITGTSTFRVEGGRIREIWVNMDRLAMMQQLGWLPVPAGAPPPAR